MDSEIAALLERGITGGIFIFLYWRERKRVTEVQDARIDDLHKWLRIAATMHPPPLSEGVSQSAD